MELIVKMRLFSGKIHYDENGNVTSTNQLYKIHYGGVNWDKFKKNVTHSFSKAVVLGVQEEHTKELTKEHNGKNHPYLEYSYKDVANIDAIKAEITALYEAPAKALTPDQKRIELLEAKIEAMINATSKPVKVKVKEEVIIDEDEAALELEMIRDEYLEVVGKKPSHLSKKATLIKAINEAKR